VKGREHTKLMKLTVARARSFIGDALTESRAV
jgi:hypothetical protein